MPTQTSTIVKHVLIVMLTVLAASHAWAGPTNGPDPNATTPNDSSDNGNSCPTGMPVYSFKSMMASLNISDIPEGYTPPIGQRIETRLTYNERESDQPASFDSFNIGQKWTLNWLTWIQDNPAQPGSQVLRYVAGGGGVPYSGYNTASASFAPEPDNGAVLVMISSSPVHYELRYTDGSKDEFAVSDNASSYPRKVFLTQRIDAQGNATRLSYDDQLRLTSVTDAIGQITTFSYDNSSYPLLLTSITDPFGRSATLSFDASQRLTSITDVMGMTSSFTYDSGTFITSMTTPYGTTTFAHSEGAGGNSSELSIQATDPDGNTERTEFLQAAPGIPFSEAYVPSGMGTFNAYLNYRDSYYWDKKPFPSRAAPPMARSVATTPRHASSSFCTSNRRT